MDPSKSPAGGYILAAVLGAIVGGITISIITRAVPAMMSRMMSNMMGDMMMRMGGEGRNPEEICRRMMGGFSETPLKSA